MTKTALIVVDVQNDFAHPDGNLCVNGGEEAIHYINRMVPDYDVVIYTKDFHPEVTTHFADYGGPWPTHCVKGTWGSEFHRDLRVETDAPIVLKGIDPNVDGYSGFYYEDDEGHHETQLNSLLTDLGVDEVCIVGIALDVCVKATALDAVYLGYDTVVVRRATAPVTPEGGDQAIIDLTEAGVTIL
ncbi:MAG: isochorismatase family protein [Pontimonas sp.]